MSFGLSLIFAEVGINFPVSYKVNELLLSEIIKNFPKENQQVIVNGSPFALGVIISTKKDMTSLSIQGPSVSKKYKMVDYTIWMPYNKIIDNEDILCSYLDYLGEGIMLVLNKCNYSNDIVPEIMMEVKKRVLNNPEYAYDEEEDKW